MEKKRRNEVMEKKIDKTKDRGDLRKAPEQVTNKNDENIQTDMKIPHPERGDSDQPTKFNQVSDKTKLNMVMKKLKSITDTTEKELGYKKSNDDQGKLYNLELRKRIRDKYTLKLKSSVPKTDRPQSINSKKDESKPTAITGSAKSDRPEKISEETKQTQDKIIQSTEDNIATQTESVPEKKPERNTSKPDKTSAKSILSNNKNNRKPMIKTIMSKNGQVRIFKAVTFVDQVKNPTPLEISIPTDPMKKLKVTKCTDTSSLKFRTKNSHTNIKEKPAAVRKKSDKRKEKKKLSKYVLSPDCSKVIVSPPTEVARWAPASIDEQTKPYYEAWVNTTLAAISKNSKKDKLFYEKYKESLIQSLKKARQERPDSPELVYENYSDERYTGRIKVRQR